MSKRVLITGATGNVGKACQDYAKANGWDVTGACRKNGLDLSNWQKVHDWVYGAAPYDLVIMAHGVQRPTLLKNMRPGDWSYVIENNLTSSLNLISALLDFERINRGGMVVYFSSIQASQPRAGRGAYAAAKAGIEALARSTAVEGFNAGIRSVALRVGQMTTPMQDIHFNEAEMKLLKDQIPLEWVSPEAVARLTFALYEQPSITGEVIEISSGHKLSIWQWSIS